MLTARRQHWRLVSVGQNLLPNIWNDIVFDALSCGLAVADLVTHRLLMPVDRFPWPYFFPQSRPLRVPLPKLPFKQKFGKLAVRCRDYRAVGGPTIQVPQIPIDIHKLRPPFTALRRQSIVSAQRSCDSGFDFVSIGLKFGPASARLLQLGFEIAALQQIQESGNQLRSCVLGNVAAKAFAEVVYVKDGQSMGAGRNNIKEEKLKIISCQFPSSGVGSGCQTITR